MNASSPVIKRGVRRVLGCLAVMMGVLLGGFQSASLLAAENRLDELKPWLALLAGELHGVFTPVEGRPLIWGLAWSSNNGTVRKGEVTVKGTDISLKIAVEFEFASGRLRWRADEGRVDLGSWLPVLATRPELKSLLAGLSATGVVTIKGEGMWSDGVVTGGLRAELAEGTVRNEADGWSLEGVTFRMGGDAAGLFKARVPFELVVRTISTSRFGARNLTMSATVDDFERVQVNAAQVEIAGGEVRSEPLSVRLSEPAIDVSLVMQRVGLQDLVVFVPTALSDARGRINGKLRLKWNSAEGVQVGEGGLQLDKSEPTTLRLVSAPGFLTEKVPARFTWLPPCFGPLARWLAPANPGYKTLSEIERGKLGLHVESLEVRLTPEGDERGRSASVVIRARPEQDGTAVGEVTLEVNVAGPLAAVLRLGMNQNLSLSSN